MRDYFDVIAWLTGFGTWLFSATTLFVAIAAFDLNPLWLALSFPIPFISVAISYALRLRSLPKLARQLGDLDDKKRKRAFEQLLSMGQSSVDAFLKILHAPRKKEEIAEWNGLAATILAVEGLGRLKAKKAVPDLLKLLHGSERDVCERVIKALGEIGERSVVPELLPFLGSEFLNGVTKETLHKLGADDLVDLFYRAMQRDKGAIELIRTHPYRNAFIASFIRALWNWEDLSLIPNAAWALAELWAIEAIPALRAQVSRWLPTEIRQACKRALDKLEMVTKLPRAASYSEIDTSTLPRPATTIDIPVENLPKAATLENGETQSD
ncbi:MAG: HEAT repeat domain-containing protein [Armatimonadota bacterium]